VFGHLLISLDLKIARELKSIPFVNIKLVIAKGGLVDNNANEKSVL
jgi:hypothetical protein